MSNEGNVRHVKSRLISVLKRGTCRHDICGQPIELQRRVNDLGQISEYWYHRDGHRLCFPITVADPQ